METNSSDVTPGVDWWWAGPSLGWLGLQFALTVFAVVTTFFSTFNVASCTEISCDYSAFSASTNALYAGAMVLLAVSVLAIILLRTRGRAMVWPPVVCSILLLLLLAVTYVAGRVALTLPLFGNRLPGCC